MEIKKKLSRSLLGLLVCIMISSCSILPGMQGVNTFRMRMVGAPEEPVRPTLIPITPSLLLNRSIPSYVYRVAPQDILNIHVWQHPEYSPPVQTTSTASSDVTQAAGQPGYLVDHTGRIFFPLAGYIYVNDKTVDQIRREITKRLRRFIKNPQIVVRVADFRSKKLYVLGEVKKPGLLPLNDQKMSITDAITLAGSFDQESADTRHIYVIRGDLLCPTVYWLNAATAEALLLGEYFQLQPNDIVYVSSALVTRWNRFLKQLIPSLSTVVLTKVIVDH